MLLWSWKLGSHTRWNCTNSVEPIRPALKAGCGLWSFGSFPFCDLPSTSCLCLLKTELSPLWLHIFCGWYQSNKYMFRCQSCGPTANQAISFQFCKFIKWIDGPSLQYSIVLCSKSKCPDFLCGNKDDNGTSHTLFEIWKDQSKFPTEGAKQEIALFVSFCCFILRE